MTNQRLSNRLGKYKYSTRADGRDETKYLFGIYEHDKQLSKSSSEIVRKLADYYINNDERFQLVSANEEHIVYRVLDCPVVIDTDPISYNILSILHSDKNKREETENLLEEILI